MEIASCWIGTPGVKVGFLRARPPHQAFGVEGRRNGWTTDDHPDIQAPRPRARSPASVTLWRCRGRSGHPVLQTNPLPILATSPVPSPSRFRQSPTIRAVARFQVSTTTHDITSSAEPRARRRPRSVGGPTARSPDGVRGSHPRAGCTGLLAVGTSGSAMRTSKVASNAQKIQPKIPLTQYKKLNANLHDCRRTWTYVVCRHTATVWISPCKSEPPSTSA